METLLKNKIINTFENERPTEPAPFYTNEGTAFYKNRLIAIEEIISIEKSSGHNENTKKHFDVFDSRISYNLTFEDEKGNTHIQNSTKKPRQIGDMFYYVTNDDKLTHIVHETDKQSLKRFISLDKGKYGDYTGKKFKITNFINKKQNLFALFILTLLMMDLILGAYFFIHNKTSIPYLVIFSLGGLLPLLLITLVMETWDKCDKEIAKIISDKKENIFKSFI